jgi:hypothetical protein
MTDQFPPPGWLPRPATWPYWLPTTQLSNAGDHAAAWLRSAMPPISNGGILGSFPHMNDADAEISPNRSGGILGSFGPLSGPSDQSIRGGILAPLERLNPGRPQAIPAWLQSAMPFAANAGSAAPWPTLPYLYPLLAQLQTHYTAAPQSNHIDAIAAPLEHLESAQYWGAGSTPRARAASVPPAVSICRPCHPHRIGTPCRPIRPTVWRKCSQRLPVQRLGERIRP